MHVRSSNPASSTTRINLRPQGIAALGDAHGLRRWSSRAISLCDKASLIIALGDLIDRNPNNMDVINTAKSLTESGNMVPLWGNHDLMFTLAMLGDIRQTLEWFFNGGIVFAYECSLSKKKSMDDIRRFRQYFAENRDDHVYLRQWVKDHAFISNLFYRLLMRNVRNNNRLVETARWMTDNMRLYFIDDLGTLYMHSGVSYLLKPGLVAGPDKLPGLLNDLQNRLRNALAADHVDFGDSIFREMLHGRESFLYGRNFDEATHAFRFTGVDPGSIGVKRIVIAHEPQESVLNINGRYFCLDLSGIHRVGSFHITPGQIRLEGLDPVSGIFQSETVTI